MDALDVADVDVSVVVGTGALLRFVVTVGRPVVMRLFPTRQASA